MEDFVSFEISKKLKEKGFTQGFNTFGYKPVFSDENTIKYISDIGAYEKEYFGINIPCPTISQVLKWLKDEKKIHICIYPTCSGFYTDIYIDVHNYYENESGRWTLYSHKEKTLTSGITFEHATECALQYVLDNLI